MVISWTLAEGLTANRYDMTYSSTDTECPTYGTGISGIDASETMYRVYMRKATEYSITVTAILRAGGRRKVSFTFTTMATG